MAGEVLSEEMEDCASHPQDVDHDVLHQNDISIDSSESNIDKKPAPRAALSFMEVKTVVAASFGENGKRCYKVHWRDSWVYDDHLFGCTELVDKFWKEQKAPTQINKSTYKRDAEGRQKKDVTVIVIGKDHSENTSDGVPSNSEIDGDWMLDGMGSDDETKENDADWSVDSHTKKIRPTGKKYTLTCHVCGEEYELVSAFRRHYSDHHPGIKPFACNLCNKRFDRKENLNRHIRIHTGDRRYVCNYCGKGYTDPSGLKKHVISKHSNVKFTCNVCPATFKSKDSLNRHLTKHLSDYRFNKKDESTIDPSAIASSSRKPLLENNTQDETSIVLMSTDETNQNIVDTGGLTNEQDNTDLKTEPLQNVVHQLQQYVDSGGTQVVQYMHMSHGATGDTHQQPSEQDALNNEPAKQFLFTHGETHQREQYVIPITSQQMLSINNSSPQDIPISTHQVLPVVTPDQPTQIITVPIATTQTFVYTGSIAGAPNNVGSTNGGVMDNQGRM